MRADEFATKWTTEAEVMRQRGVLVNGALLLEEILRDFDAVTRGRARELLTLTDGAAESGYSAEYLGALIRQGKIQNAGRPHAPRILRQDLPRKASRLPDPPSSLKLVGATPRQIARAIISSKE
ncbi:MAG: hypothetical protein SFV24_05475 [Gemmatimonadales bacterium]|nr:hypothetical protein [Gemmatimonadales bacterium]